VMRRGPGRWRSIIAGGLGVLVLLAMLCVPRTTVRAAFVYWIPAQEDQLTIEPDGLVKLRRYFEFMVGPSSTERGTEIWAGLPTASTRVLGVVDKGGKPVTFTTRSQGRENILVLRDFPPIQPGAKLCVTVYAEVPDFLYQDTENKDYVTLRYVPGWWSSRTGPVEVSFVFPPGVTQSDIRTGRRQWSAAGPASDGRTIVAWRVGALAPNERLTVQAGFPASRLTGNVNVQAKRPASGSGRGSQQAVGAVIAVLGGVVALLAGLARVARRERYSSPIVSADGVGVNRDLSVFEAAALLKEEPSRVLTLVLLELCRKGLVRVKETDPLRVQKVAVANAPEDLSAPERNLLEAIDGVTGLIDAEAMIALYLRLARKAMEKTRPFCRRDTEQYYREKTKEAWAAVEAAGSPQVRFSEYDRNMLWCLLDKDVAGRTQRLFPAESRYSAPSNYWYWTYFPGAHFLPHAPLFPGYMLFHSMNRSFLDVSGRIVPGREAELQAAQEQALNPAAAEGGWVAGRAAHIQRGYAPPPGCACACACVSCACACACAGGGGCT
jgi:hypothetical protein